MRISHYAQDAIRAAGLTKSATADTSSRTSHATSAVNLRLSETGKTLSKAASAKDDITRVDAGLAKLQKAIAKAQAKDITPEDRAQAQADFIKARTEVADAAATQAKNLSSAPDEVRRAGAVTTESLGASKTATSVKSVKGLDAIDLTTASADQLAEAARVVQSARDDIAQRQAVATKPVEALTRKVTILENTVASLGGEPSTKSQQRQMDALKVLQQAVATQSPLATGLNLFA